MVEQSYLFSPLSSGYSKFLNIFDSTELEKVFDVQKSKPPSLLLPTVQYGEKAQRIDDFNVSLESGFLHLLEESVVVTPKVSPLFIPTNIVPIVEESNRLWDVSFIEGYENNQVELCWKTRNQQFEVSLPDKMYSSLKYEFKVKLISSSLNLPFVLARIYILEEETKQVQKEKDILVGIVECAMSKEKSGYVGSLRVQMSHTLAFYHSKKSFFFQIRFYDPQQIQSHFASISSPSFKIYARKPNSTEKKRKNPTKETSLKKLKTSNDFTEFSSCLDNLLKVNSKLNKEEKKIALEMVLKKFKEEEEE